MSRNYSKGVFTLEEISQMVLDKFPGRFKNLKSAYATVKATVTELGIEDINGKKRYKLISARDADRVLARIREKARVKKTAPKAEKKTKAVQVSLFDKGVVDWLEPYTQHVEKDENKKASTGISSEELEELRDRLANIAAELIDIIDDLTTYFTDTEEE